MVRLIAEHGQQLFAGYREASDLFMENSQFKIPMSCRRKIWTLGKHLDWDDSKLVIFTWIEPGDRGMSFIRSFEKYHLRMEMVSGYYVLGIQV